MQGRFQALYALRPWPAWFTLAVGYAAELEIYVVPGKEELCMTWLEEMGALMSINESGFRVTVRPATTEICSLSPGSSLPSTPA
jgi:hypothetical protein